MVLARALIVLGLVGSVAMADPATTLRDANAAATAGEWTRVQELVGALLAPAQPELAGPDHAEADRLAGLASFFLHRTADAETYFVAYLKLDLDGHLDPALYPPEVVNFFNEVRTRHAGELHAIRSQPRRYWPLALLPPVAQFQNGERVKGIVLGSLLGALLATNITTYFVLRSWCHNPGSTCDASGTNHFRGAETLTGINAVTGIGFIVTYAYGVWDGVRGYRRRSVELTPYMATTSDQTSFGLVGGF